MYIALQKNANNWKEDNQKWKW